MKKIITKKVLPADTSAYVRKIQHRYAFDVIMRYAKSFMAANPTEEAQKIWEEFIAQDKRTPLCDALRSHLVLPPCNCSLRWQIRYFLGMVEPWLRTGWVMPSPWPSLFADQQAHSDPLYFSTLDQINATYPPITLAEIDALEAGIDLTADSQTGRIEILGKSSAVKTMAIRLAMQNFLITSVFHYRYYRAGRPSMPFDWLFIQYQRWEDQDYWQFHDWLHPPILPFGTKTLAPHIGVATPNAQVMQKATMLGKRLDLPIQSYHMSQDDAGVQKTQNALASCQLLLAEPDAIADLAVISKVPCLILADRWDAMGWMGTQPLSKVALMVDGSDDDLVALAKRVQGDGPITPHYSTRFRILRKDWCRLQEALMHIGHAGGTGATVAI